MGILASLFSRRHCLKFVPILVHDLIGGFEMRCCLKIDKRYPELTVGSIRKIEMVAFLDALQRHGFLRQQDGML